MPGAEVDLGWAWGKVKHSRICLSSSQTTANSAWFSVWQVITCMKKLTVDVLITVGCCPMITTPVESAKDVITYITQVSMFLWR